MPNKLQIAAGMVFALAVAHDIKTQIKTTKAAYLFLEASKAYEETQAANAKQIQYLCHMLDKHGIPADEFDLIALNYNQ